MGRDILAAALLALEDYKSRRGNAAAAVELDFVDDGCSTEGGALAAKQITGLTGDARPIAVVGHTCPSAAQSAGPVYGAAGLVFVGAGALANRQIAIRRYGALHFRLPGDGSPGGLIASTILDDPEPRIAIVRDRTQYAIEATQSILAALGPKSRNVIFNENFAGGEKDFAALAQKLKTAGVTHIVLSVFPSEGGLLVGDIRKANLDVVILATDQLADPEFARISSAAADGVLVPLPADYRTLETANEIVRRAGITDAPSSGAALMTYAALESVLSALDSQQPTHPAALAQALQTRQFETILGAVRFDGSGAASLPRFALFAWDAGRLVPVSAKGMRRRGVATRTPLQ